MQVDSAERATPARPQRVAIIDMDRRVRAAIAELLQAAGVEVVGTSGDPAHATDLLEQGAEILIIDPRMPDLATGQAFISSVNRTWPKVQVVVIGWSDAGESRVTLNAA